MRPSQIYTHIRKHVSLTESEEDNFSSLLRFKKVKKKDLIQTQGSRCKNLYFVESGCLRAFHINEEGKESTIMFALEDWWITDMNSFVNQTVADLSIEAIDRSELVFIGFEELQGLFKTIPKFERVFRILFQNAYIREQKRALLNISKTTEERYYLFLKQYPQISKKVTQRQIASYLGVTPEFLSSIKNK